MRFAGNDQRGASGKDGDVSDNALLLGMRVGELGDTEIVTNIGEDVGKRAIGGVVFEVKRIKTVLEFDIGALGEIVLRAVAVKIVIDDANVAPAGGHVVGGGETGCFDRLG